MWAPRELKCDLCGQKIDHETPSAFAVLSIPLSQEDRERIYADIKKQLPAQVHVLGLEAAGMVPTAWKLEICLMCVEGSMPNASFVKTNQIIEAITRRQSIHEKNKLAMTHDDDD